MQSLACHRRITNRIEQLLDQQIHDFASMMTDEVQCRNKLKVREESCFSAKKTTHAHFISLSKLKFDEKLLSDKSEENEEIILINFFMEKKLMKQ